MYADLLEASANQIRENYVVYAQPLDLRYAHKVHGAALAPSWDTVWTDDPTIRTDPQAIAMVGSCCACLLRFASVCIT